MLLLYVEGIPLLVSVVCCSLFGHCQMKAELRMSLQYNRIQTSQYFVGVKSFYYFPSKSIKVPRLKILSERCQAESWGSSSES